MHPLASLFHEAGPFAWPVAATGLAALALALHFVVAARPKGLALVVGSIATCLAVGVLGATIGIEKSAAAITRAPGDAKWLFYVGVGESLTCVTLALVFVVPSVLAATIGAHRRGD